LVEDLSDEEPDFEEVISRHYDVINQTELQGICFVTPGESITSRELLPHNSTYKTFCLKLILLSSVTALLDFLTLPGSQNSNSGKLPRFHGNS
jgi:hypothetical protein